MHARNGRTARRSGPFAQPVRPPVRPARPPARPPARQASTPARLSVDAWLASQTGGRCVPLPSAGGAPFLMDVLSPLHPSYSTPSTPPLLLHILQASKSESEKWNVQLKWQEELAC